MGKKFESVIAILDLASDYYFGVFAVISLACAWVLHGHPEETVVLWKHFMWIGLIGGLYSWTSLRLKEQHEYTDLQEKIYDAQADCLKEMAYALVPHIGEDKVIEILRKYGVALEDIIKDYDDRNKPWWRRIKKPAFKAPEWVEELKAKIHQELARET